MTKPATATKPGEKERTCKRCNEKETETVPATGSNNKPGGGSGSGGNSGAGGSSDNSGGNSGDNGGDTGGSGSGAGGGNSAGNSGGTGAGTSKAPGTGKPKVKQEKERNIQKEVRVEGTDTLDAAVETPLSELADMVLTKEEKQKAAGGTDVKIVLEVKDASATVSAADKVLVEKALNGSQAKGYKLGQHANRTVRDPFHDSGTDLYVTVLCGSQVRHDRGDKKGACLCNHRLGEAGREDQKTSGTCGDFCAAGVLPQHRQEDVWGVERVD